MKDEHHLLRTHYADLMRGKTPPRWLLHRLFRHLLELCPTCRHEWQSYCDEHRHRDAGFPLGSRPPSRPGRAEDGWTPTMGSPELENLDVANREVVNPALLRPEEEAAVSALDELTSTFSSALPLHSSSRPSSHPSAPSSNRPTAPSSKGALSRDTESISDQRIAEVFERVRAMRQQITEDQQQAMDLFSELMALPDTASRVQRVRRSSRFRSWSLCDLLLQQSHEAGFRDPAFAEELAELAVESAWVLEHSELPGATVADLLARGWGILANARRLMGRLSLAGETFLMAYFFLEQGTGDPIVIAEILGYEASLRRDQRQLDLALRLLRKVDSIYRRTGEDHLQGRTALKIALTLHDHGEITAALAQTERAQQLVDASREPRLELAVGHTQVLLLHEAGLGAQARAAFEQLQPLYERFDDRWTQLRRQWVAGKIAAGLGEVEDAEVALRQAREGFIRQGLGYDTALVSLDLSALLLQQGRTIEVRELARQMISLFTSLDLEQEALSALITFCEAANAERATVEAARKTLRHLDQLYRRRRRCGSLPS
ncbi:MAG: hypothetical protein AAGD01_07725 [Acidobacteriota bacterium]